MMTVAESKGWRAQHHSWWSSRGHLKVRLCPTNSEVKERHPYKSPSSQPGLGETASQARPSGKARQENTSVAVSAKCCRWSSHHCNL